MDPQVQGHEVFWSENEDNTFFAGRGGFASKCKALAVSDGMWWLTRLQGAKICCQVQAWIPLAHGRMFLAA